MGKELEPSGMLAAFERTGDGVFAVDQEQRIVFWDAKAAEILGYTAEDVLGKHCFDVIVGGDFPAHPFCGTGCDVIECAGRGRPVSNYDVRTKTANGEPRWLNISIVVLAGRNRRDNLAVHLFRDVTTERRRQLASAPASPSVSEEPAALSKLTRREAEVLRHLSAGLSNVQIAEALGTSPTTVRNHIEHVLAKLGVHSRLEAVVLAAQHRLV